MAYVPTGILRQPYLAKLMLATSTRFRSLVGAADSSAAKTRIAIFEAPGAPDEEMIAPRAIIMRGLDWERAAAGTGLAYSPHGSLVLVLEIPIPEPTEDLQLLSREDQSLWFEDQVAQIMVEMEAAVNARAAIETQNPFFFRSWRILEGPDRESTEERPTKDPETESDTQHPNALPMRPLWWITLQLDV